MTTLIACLSTGKGTWGHVGRLLADGQWEKAFLVTNDFGKENFSSEKAHEKIVVDTKKGVEELREEIINQLKGKITGTEVALNLVSGTGREHMAITAAILKLGFGIRFVLLTKDGIKEV